MTVAAPPKPPAPREVEARPQVDPLEALIEEARRRARRRRQLYGLSAALIAAAALIGLFAGRGGGSHATAGVPRASHVNVPAAALKTAGRLTVIGTPSTGRQQPPAQADGWYALSAVAPSAYIVRCPGHSRWCGEVESIDWAANGRWLALSVTSFGVANPYNGIHVIDVTTRIDRQIRSCVPGECDWFDLDWSRDGSRLAYVSGGWIYTINRDGSGERRLLTGTAGPDSSPSWSPDGRQIAFASRPRPHTLSSVYGVRPDGTHRILLARGASDPAWSPDGTKIAVASHCVGIKLITFAGRDVTPGAGPCRVIGVSGMPIWSPDGRRIAIVGHSGNPVFGGSGVYVMNASGEHLRLVTGESSAGVTGRPDASWQPRRQS
jgi:hypothetical protein